MGSNSSPFFIMTTDLIILKDAGEYKDTRYLSIAYLVDKGTRLSYDMYTAEVGICVALLERDNKWWIIPSDAGDDDRFEAMGPYDEPIAGMAMARLILTETFRMPISSDMEFDIVAIDV